MSSVRRKMREHTGVAQNVDGNCRPEEGAWFVGWFVCALVAGGGCLIEGKRPYAMERALSVRLITGRGDRAVDADGGLGWKGFKGSGLLVLHDQTLWQRWMNG